MIFNDTPNALAAAPPARDGYVVEARIFGHRMWLVEPVPGEAYTFTHKLSDAHVWAEHHQAWDVRCCVWCGYFDPAWKAQGRPGAEGAECINVQLANELYRACAAEAVAPPYFMEVILEGKQLRLSK